MALSHLLLLVCLSCAVLTVTSHGRGGGRRRGPVRGPGSPGSLRGPPVGARSASAARRIAYPPFYYQPRCCPAGWTSTWNRCFMYHSKAKTWFDAEKHCVSLGGHLTSIRGYREDRFVKGMVRRLAAANNPVWIGAFNTLQAGAWLWLDGNRFNTLTPSRHLKMKTDKECVLLYPGDSYWHECKCDQKRSYVCGMTK